ncbi:MAG: hypothetical protein K2W99_04020 [Chthoniobacterales bacterium]|nr:hypothetical protein [Chthoniobacterales bacterium]
MKKIPLFFLVTLLLIIPFQVMAMMERGKEGDTTSTEESSREKIKEDSQKEADREIIASIGPTQISSTSPFSVKNVLIKSESSENISSQEKVPPIMSAPNISSLQPNAQPRSLEEPSSASVEEKRKSPFVLEEDNQRQLRQAMLAEIRNKAQERLQKASSIPSSRGAKKVAFIEKENSFLVSEKIPSARATKKNEFKQCVRTLMNLVSSLQSPINDADTIENPNRSNKIRELPETAYPQIKKALEELLVLISENPKGIDKAGMIYEKASPEVKHYLQTLLGEVSADCKIQKEKEPLLATIKLVEIAFFLSDLKIKAHAILKEDPNRSNKIAALYREACTQQQKELQTLLKAIESGELALNEETALDLGSTTISVMETAFKSVDRKKIRPFQLEKNIEYPVMNIRKIEYDPVPYESVNADDMRDLYLLWEAENVISNAKDIMKALVAPKANKETALCCSHLMKASRASFIASMKVGEIQRKLVALGSLAPFERPVGAWEQTQEELTKANNDYEECIKNENLVAQELVLKIDPTMAKERVFTDALSISNTSLLLSNQLIEILISKTTE